MVSVEIIEALERLERVHDDISLVAEFIGEASHHVRAVQAHCFFNPFLDAATEALMACPSQTVIVTLAKQPEPIPHEEAAAPFPEATAQRYRRG